MSRPITFPKTANGVWTNRETGVDIVVYGNGYRAFRPALTSTGTVGICQEVRTLAEARYRAARYVRDSFRHLIAQDHAEGLNATDPIQSGDLAGILPGLPR